MPYVTDPSKGKAPSNPPAADPSPNRQPPASQFDSLSHDMTALEFMPMDITHLDMDWEASLSR